MISPSFIVAVLVTAIHAFERPKTWMAGTKPGHDGGGFAHRGSMRPARPAAEFNQTWEYRCPKHPIVRAIHNGDGGTA